MSCTTSYLASETDPKPTPQDQHLTAVMCDTVWSVVSWTNEAAPESCLCYYVHKSIPFRNLAQRHSSKTRLYCKPCYYCCHGVKVNQSVNKRVAPSLKYIQTFSTAFTALFQMTAAQFQVGISMLLLPVIFKYKLKIWILIHHWFALCMLLFPHFLSIWTALSLLD